MYDLSRRYQFIEIKSKLAHIIIIHREVVFSSPNLSEWYNDGSKLKCKDTPQQCYDKLKPYLSGAIITVIHNNNRWST